MMRMTVRWLTLGLTGLLLVACDPGEDNAGPSIPRSDVGSTLDVSFDGGDGGGRDGTVDFGPGTGGIECHLQLDTNEACVGCIVDQCGDELRTAFGVAGYPTQPGGACTTFLSCVDACDCADDDCALQCSEAMDEGCQAALAAGQSCQQESCATECSDEPPGDDVCAQVVGILSAGTNLPGSLSEDDPNGGPQSAYYDTYTLSMAGLDGVTVFVISPDFDTYLYAYDTSCTEVSSDDDGGEGTNSSLQLEGGRGDYFVIVTSFGSGETGSYDVGVTTP